MLFDNNTYPHANPNTGHPSDDPYNAGDSDHAYGDSDYAYGYPGAIDNTDYPDYPDHPYAFWSSICSNCKWFLASVFGGGRY